MPTGTYQGSNYWVDIVFEVSGVPPQPSNIRATPGNGITTLTWTQAPTATSYTVKRAVLSGCPYAGIAGGLTGTSFVDRGVSNGTKYYYVVSATNPLGEGPNSSEVQSQPEQTIAGCLACYTLWTPDAVPSLLDHNDPNGIEVGVRFQSEVSGYVLGVRFYKGPTNTGTHIANLWTDAGINLARTIANNESASGWQTAWFGNPIPITANAYYVASYFAPNGNYSWDDNYFSFAGLDNSPLHAPETVPFSSGNGVYLYTSSTAFPANTYQGSNYWVDLVFEASGAPFTPTGLNASAANGSVTLNWNASQFAASYNIKRSTSNGGPYTTIATGVTGTSYVNTGVTNGTVYYYVVSAVDKLGESANSSQVSAQPNGPLQINTTSLPSATFGASYSYQLSGGGGAGPYSWTASGLPPFLSIASGGLISGTPFGFGNYTVSVTLTDSAQHSVTRQFNLAISF